MTTVHFSLFVVLFFAVWFWMFGSFLFFWRYVAPSALRRWADEGGYRIVESKQPWDIEWYSFSKGNGHRIYQVIYRVRVTDQSGLEQHALVRVGTPYWFCTSVSRCTVEVRWGARVSVIERIRRLTDPARYGWKGPVLGSRFTARRLVVGFAVADLLLAVVVLAFELLLVFAIAFAVDEIWEGSLGLNRLVGRTPRPELIGDTRLLLAGSLGFFALYLPALVTLTAGGIGLILRKPWGYTWHMAGSALVAVSIFGVVYTIPALLVAIQPWFKEECLGGPSLVQGKKADWPGEL
jgi:hypothetical protein